MVLASAANAYAVCSGIGASETATSPGRALYLGSKVAQELVVAADCAAHGIPLAVMRISSIIGTGDSIVDAFARRLGGGEDITLEAGGSFSADFVSADNVAQGLLIAVREGLRGTFNLSSGHSTSLAEVAEELRHLTGAKAAQIITRGYKLSTDQGFAAVDCERLRSLGYSPDSLGETLARIVTAQNATGAWPQPAMVAT